MDEAADGLDDIRGFNQARGPSCQAGIVLASIDPAIRRTVEAAMKDETIERAAIVRWLDKRHGISISKNSFIRHAKGDCRCG